MSNSTRCFQRLPILQEYLAGPTTWPGNRINVLPIRNIFRWDYKIRSERARRTASIMDSGLSWFLMWALFSGLMKPDYRAVVSGQVAGWIRATRRSDAASVACGDNYVHGRIRARRTTCYLVGSGKILSWAKTNVQPHMYTSHKMFRARLCANMLPYQFGIVD
jgi:hypothetical protein